VPVSTSAAPGGMMNVAGDDYEVRGRRGLRVAHNTTSWATASGIGLSPATHRRTVRGFTLSRRAASIWPMPTRWRWRLSAEGVIAFERRALRTE
jgi:hypothetical protein